MREVIESGGRERERERERQPVKAIATEKLRNRWPPEVKTV